MKFTTFGFKMIFSDKYRRKLHKCNDSADIVTFMRQMYNIYIVEIEN